MHKLEYLQENEIHKILWNFRIQMNHSILTRRWNLVLINKKKRTYLGGFFYSSKPLSESKGKQTAGQITQFC